MKVSIHRPLRHAEYFVYVGRQYASSAQGACAGLARKGVGLAKKGV